MSVQIGILASLQVVSDFFDDVLDLGERRSILRVGVPARNHYTLVSEQFNSFICFEILSKWNCSNTVNWLEIFASKTSCSLQGWGTVFRYRQSVTVLEQVLDLMHVLLRSIGQRSSRHQLPGKHSVRPDVGFFVVLQNILCKVFFPQDFIAAGLLRNCTISQYRYFRNNKRRVFHTVITRLRSSMCKGLKSKWWYFIISKKYRRLIQLEVKIHRWKVE